MVDKVTDKGMFDPEGYNEVQRHYAKLREFQKELEMLLNRFSIDNDCETPDFILAEHIVNYLSVVYAPTIKKRDSWFGGTKRETSTWPS